MTYNVRDRNGRFTKIRHSERDRVTGRFVSQTVDRHSLRDEVGRFRSAKKYSVRDGLGRFSEVNYRHNVRDDVTGRFISARKFDDTPWLNDEDYNSIFDTEDNDIDDDFDSLFDDEYNNDSYPCECETETNLDVDDDGTPFCTECLGDVDLDNPPRLWRGNGRAERKRKGGEEIDDFDYA